jgi:hypothetical protein
LQAGEIAEFGADRYFFASLPENGSFDFATSM